MKALFSCTLFLFVSFLFSCTPPYRNQIDLNKIYLQSPKMLSLDREIYRYSDKAPDSQYGLTINHNIKVAYRNNTDTLSGPKMEHYYLAHLSCNCGGDVKYYRIGSCCPVPSKNAIFGDSALLDIYKIKCSKCKNSCEIYLNMYDNDTALYSPNGYTFKSIQ